MPTSSLAPNKRLTLLACILGTTVVLVDSTVVNVALPEISRDLGGGLAGQQWTSNAYLLTLGSLLLVGGSLGDIYGERRVFVFGVLAFGATSLVCAVAPTIGVLVAGRALQGMSGALLTPAALAVIVAVFEQGERNRAIGAWTAWSGIGAALGPLIGGQLIDAASWRWVFAINLPLVVLTVVLILRALPERAGRKRGRLDLAGAVLCVAGLAGITFGLIQQPLDGWGSPSVAAPIAAGAVLFCAFLLYERRASAPMLPLELFRRRNFAIGNVETFSMYAGLSLLFFYLIIYLQQVAGYDALEAGTATLPVTIVMLSLASRFGALADRLGPRLFMGLGPLVAGSGLLLLLRLDQDVSYFTDLLPAITLFALGLSMTVAPLTATVLADAEERNAGVASGVNNAIARVAGLVAISGVGVLIAAGFASDLDERLQSQPLTPAARAAVDRAKANPLIQPELGAAPPREREAVSAAVTDASVSSFRIGMAVSAALVISGGLLGAAGIRNPRRKVAASDCAGGQLAGQPADAARREEECPPESAALPPRPTSRAQASTS
jgi:EmrB/QacA subfamily drug resistance transporter